MDLSKLAEPFKYEDLEFRISRSGNGNSGVWAVALTYITARAIHDRLDEVCGPENWQLRYVEHNGGTVCEIGIWVNESWVWKAGGSDSTQIEAFKGGLSGAEKRAGVPWGIGRYLYKLSRYPDIYVKISDQKQQGWNYQGANRKNNIPKFYWENPPLQPEFLPTPQKATEAQINNIDKLCNVEGMESDDKANIRIFYCNSKHIPVTEWSGVSEELAQNFIDKFELVFNAWKNVVQK